MGALNRAAAHMNRGGQNLIRLQLVEQQANSHHVRHRIQRPHLMEVYLPHRHPMGPGLRLGNGLIDRQGVPAHRLR